jgi:transcriptional regulator with XRE-family HTH domain
MSLGLRIRKVRQQARLSQRQLASCLGLAHSTLGHWENNRSSPNAFHLLRIAEITGADVFLLLTGKPSPHSDKAAHKSERAA